MNYYYEGVVCGECGQQVCAGCGCCATPSCENCCCPDVERDEEDRSEEN